MSNIISNILLSDRTVLPVICDLIECSSFPSHTQITVFFVVWISVKSQPTTCRYKKPETPTILRGHNSHKKIHYHVKNNHKQGLNKYLISVICEMTPVMIKAMKYV